ncbi:unnamed protein product [Cuscuta campestris]|uniref:Uncharacterized protein n=1 Tax=Cuscuta campestris TaxID=132261 RepID=A0A484LIE1_9ASTE|nr:unnamed protein product [Cuscuta campestris]
MDALTTKIRQFVVPDVTQVVEEQKKTVNEQLLTTAKLLADTKKLCREGAVEIRTVVTEESLAKLGFEFVRDDHRHQPTLLRDLHGKDADSGPFVEPKGEAEDDMLLLRHLKVDQKEEEKKNVAPHGNEHRLSSSHEDHFQGGDRRGRSRRTDSRGGVGGDGCQLPVTGKGKGRPGVFELARRMNTHQSALDEVKEAVEAEKKKLRDETDHLTKELLEERTRSSNLERENRNLHIRTWWPSKRPRGTTWSAALSS